MRFHLGLWCALAASSTAFAEEPAPAEPTTPAPTDAQPAPEAKPVQTLPAAPASASQPLGARPTFELDLPEVSLSLERVPPKVSYEFGVSLSYGTVTWWREYFDSWIGFGFRGGYGRNVGKHRYGFDAHVVAEGPIGVHTTLAFEPHMSWDFISGGGLLLGAGVGPAIMYHTAAGPSAALPGEKAMSFAPSAVARIGWSQTWSRVGRRLFVYLEPKVRYVDDEVAWMQSNTPDAVDVAWTRNLNPLVALVVGSGRGQ